ncbi:trimeric LpxA-like protein [Rhodotorula sp. JG-1b]|nr:trimeric LpxA-like protein [Rhodotorula sp. JG-1b]
MQGSCRKTCQSLPPTRSPSCGVLIASLSPHRRVDAFKVGPKAVVVADCDLRGDITLGTILQPRCTILAVSGPIIFGENNIVEENVIIVNRHKQPMVIGDFNLFESPTIGSHNVFGIRSRVLPSVSVGSHCVLGAGCLVQADPDSLADYMHVFGSENRQRKATGEGDGQAKALFAKHWEYLRDTLPRYHKLKMF